MVGYYPWSVQLIVPDHLTLGRKVIRAQATLIRQVMHIYILSGGNSHVQGRPRLLFIFGRTFLKLL